VSRAARDCGVGRRPEHRPPIVNNAWRIVAMMSKPPVKSLSIVLAVALAACGGGGTTTTGAGGGGGGGGATGGSLTISAATPAANNTTLDLSRATTISNNARAADGFSSTPYCEALFEGVPGANGVTYRVQVYFRQSDKAPLHTSIFGGNPPTYAVFNNNNGNPITGLTVDTTARTIVFANKVLAGASGEAGTVNGTANFPANSGTPACGA
jgi:hypothetical protein